MGVSNVKAEDMIMTGDGETLMVVEVLTDYVWACDTEGCEKEVPFWDIQKVL